MNRDWKLKFNQTFVALETNALEDILYLKKFMENIFGWFDIISLIVYGIRESHYGASLERRH